MAFWATIAPTNRSLKHNHTAYSTISVCLPNRRSGGESRLYLGSYGGTLTSALWVQTAPCGPSLLTFMPPGPASTDWSDPGGSNMLTFDTTKEGSLKHFNSIIQPTLFVIHRVLENLRFAFQGCLDQIQEGRDPAGFSVQPCGIVFTFHGRSVRFLPS